MMKRFFTTFGVILIFLTCAGNAFALNRDDAVSALTAEYAKLSVGDAGSRAESEVDGLVASMESDQYDVQVAVDNIDQQVSAMAKNSSRKDAADSALETANDRADDFTGLEADEYLRVQASIGGALPYVAPDEGFTAARDAANAAISEVRRILIAPDRPGAVPTGDIVSDFIPQIIRQLFRFAWVAVLIALTVSGVYFVMAQDDDERLTKAKSMIYYSLIGFAMIALAFAIVKAVTDIDFFAFV